MRKKLIAVTMLAVMTLSLFTGCGKDTKNESGGEKETVQQGANGDSETADLGIVQTWPDGQKITWFLRGNKEQSTYNRFENLKAIAMIEDKFNVDIEFIVANGSSEEIDQQYLLLLSSGELPDVISYLHNEAYTGGIPKLYAEDVCIELNDLIDKNMPHLKKIFEEHTNVARDMKTNDGKFLYFQRINPLETMSEKMAAGSAGIVMRQDWLDNVGLEVPTTIDEWYQVLKAFKNMDPNGNGINDEIPFDASSAGLAYFEGGFGFSSNIYIDPDTGKVNHGAVTQQYKNYLEEMNKWYSEGLIVNVFDESGNHVKATVADENIAGDIAGSWKGLANAWEKSLPLIQEKNPSAALAAAPYPIADNGVMYINNANFSSIQRETQLISTNCKSPEAVAAIIDYMYSEEGSELMLWGEEGVTFEKDANGVRTLTEFGNAQVELPDGTKPQNYKMYGNMSTGFPTFGMFEIDLASRKQEYVDACEIWSSGDFSLNYPKAVTLSAEELEKVSDGNTEISDYIFEMRWKFITGQEPISNFDAYLSNLERMGINDMIAVYQNAYDQYLVR